MRHVTLECCFVLRQASDLFELNALRVEEQTFAFQAAR